MINVCFSELSPADLDVDEVSYCDLSHMLADVFILFKKYCQNFKLTFFIIIFN